MGASMSLTGLQPVVSGTAFADPGINTKILFITDTDQSVPKTCPAILQAARSASSKKTFLDIYKLGNPLKDAQSAKNTNPSEAIVDFIETIQEFEVNLTSFLERLSSSAIDQLQNVTLSPEYPTVDAYFKEIETTQLPVIRLVSSCLEEETQGDPTIVANAAQTYETSKARYESITSGNTSVSYYEGWFPIFRPLKEVSLYILFACSLLFLVLSILTFMLMQGIELKFSLPASASASASESSFGFGFNIMEHKKFLYGGLAVGALFTGIGLWRKWF